MMFALGILTGAIICAVAFVAAFAFLTYLDATRPSGTLQRGARELQSRMSGEQKAEILPVETPEDKIEAMLREFDDL